MGRKRKRAKAVPGRGALLKNAIYKTGPKPKRRSKEPDPGKETEAAISKGQQMARIEAYAKEQGITVAQAMVHFM